MSKNNNGDFVIGPVSSTINAIATWADNTGEVLQDTNIIVDDNGNLTTTGAITSTAIDMSSDGVSLNLQKSSAQTEDLTLTFPSDAGSNGQVLATDGTGALSWVSQGTVPIQGGTGIDITGSSIQTISIANTGVTATTYTAPNLTINEQGQITSAISNNNIVIGQSDSVTGINTIPIWSANSSSNLSNTNITITPHNFGTYSDITCGTIISYVPTSHNAITADNGNLYTKAGNIFSNNGNVYTDNGYLGAKSLRLNVGNSNYITLQGLSSSNNSYTLTFPSDAGSNGQVLATDGTGVLSWQSGGGGGSGVTSVGLTTSTSGLTISNTPITSAGNIGIALNTELQGLSTIASNGIIARTTAGTYTPRTITAGSDNITITNGNGISGNPIIKITSSPTFSNLGATKDIYAGGDITGDVLIGKTIMGSPIIRTVDNTDATNVYVDLTVSSNGATATYIFPLAMGKNGDVLTLQDASTGQLKWTTPA